MTSVQNFQNFWHDGKHSRSLLSINFKFVYELSSQVLIFDFGSELYVWNGQQSLSGQRKSAFALAQQLYGEPFKPHGKNYDPIFPYGKSDSSNDKVNNKVSSGRPSWTLFARLHEKAETILFREKFLDWPDPTKIIRMKGHPSTLELAPAVCTVRFLVRDLLKYSRCYFVKLI